MKAQPLTIARLRTLLDAWAKEYGDDIEIYVNNANFAYPMRVYAADNCDLTTKAPIYAEEIEGWGDLENARTKPEFRANFPE